MIFLSCNQPVKLHCKKCGRRNRIKSEQRYCRHEHHFPRGFPSYTMMKQGQMVSKNALNQNSSRKSRPKNILMDQFVQVQQINSSKCNSLMNSCKLQCVQQMIYLRENINKLIFMIR